MKIYTKTGDKGTTRQMTGQFVPKYDPQIMALGNLDELDSWLGYVAAIAPTDTAWVVPTLQDLQRQLYELQADISVPRHDTIRESDVAALEQSIDKMMAAMPAIKAFILPGGTPVAAALQYARTIARRAERAVDELNDHGQSLPAPVLHYVNRLSDYFFALARYVNWRADREETLSKEK